MKLLKKDNKLYLYDNINDSYTLITPDDLPNIMNDENKLYDRDIILKYFQFKNNKFKTNPKGYTSKKVDLNKEYKQASDEIQKSYIISKFLNDLSGISEVDRLAFIKNPNKNTIKHFSTDKKTIDYLISKFDNINKTLITMTDNGDNLSDMLNYFSTQKIDKTIPESINISLKEAIKKYMSGDMTKEDLLNVVEMSRDYFGNDTKYKEFKRKIIELEPKAEVKTKAKPKAMKSESETEEDKSKEEETKSESENEEDKPKVNKKLDDIFENIDTTFNKTDTRIIDIDTVNNEGREEISTLNNQNKLNPIDIFKSSKIKQIKNNYFGDSSKLYRVLKYLTTTDKIDDNDIEQDESNKNKFKINVKDYGDMYITLSESGYLQKELKDILEKKDLKNIDNIFKGQTFDDMEDYEGEAKTTINYDFKSMDNPWDVNSEDLKEVIKDVADDITISEFKNMINSFHKNYQYDNYENLLKPDKNINANRRTNIIKDLLKYTNHPRRSNNLFVLESLPVSFWKKYIPENVYDSLIKDNSVKTFDDYIKLKINEEYTEKQKEILGERNENINKLNDDIKKAYEDIDKLNENINGGRNGIKTYEEEIKAYEKEIKQHKENINSIKAKQTKENKTKIDNYITQENKNIQDKTKNINKLKKDIEDFEQDIKDNEDEKKKIETELNKMKTEIEENSKNIEDDIEFTFSFLDDIETKADELNEDTEKIERLKEDFKKYYEEIYTNNDKPLWFSPLYENKGPKDKVTKASANEEMYNRAKYQKYQNNKTNKFKNELESMGGSNWSYNALKRIDNINNILSSSGSNWSYNALKRIDNINDILNDK